MVRLSEVVKERVFAGPLGHKEVQETVIVIITPAFQPAIYRLDG